jgi:hypothetical protein
MFFVRLGEWDWGRRPAASTDVSRPSARPPLPTGKVKAGRGAAGEHLQPSPHPAADGQGHAQRVLIGRATLYGLAATGETGVRHCIDILTAGLRMSMVLRGGRSIAELVPGLIRQRLRGVLR